MLVIGMGAGLAGVWVGRHLPALPGLKASLVALSAWDLLALPVLLVAVLAFHEAGHLAGGISRGMRMLLSIAGPFGLVRSPGGLRFRWYFNLGTFGGLAAAMPDLSRPLKPQMRALVAAGPGASLLLALLGAWGFSAWDGRAGAYALVVSLLSAAIFLVTAAPFRAGGFMSDGMQLLQLSRDPGMIERRSRLLALAGLSLAGSRPREVDPPLLASAQALLGSEPLYDLAVMSYSYLHALDRGEDEAGTWVDRIAVRVDEYPDGFRQSLLLELALYEALYRRNLGAAQAWLARARGGVVDSSRRDLAQAAVAALAGRGGEARDLLARAEKALGRGMDPGLARLSADQIQVLRDQIAA